VDPAGAALRRGVAHTGTTGAAVHPFRMMPWDLDGPKLTQMDPQTDGESTLSGEGLQRLTGG
jgi:hypothetical protein